MAEPQPSSLHEGADIEDDVPVLPTSAEDRKAAAALNSVAAARDDDDYSPKEVDQEALGRAMKNLDVTGGGKRKEATGKDGDDDDGGDKKKVAAAAAAVKVDQADVALLVDELDLTKAKATELLKGAEGDAVRALRSFVVEAASA